MIRVLPPQIVNQIAAGEVVERPFSVVKELVENSLDAGSTRITVDLEEGGMQLIRITDNGAGFSSADLELAFTSHATSKLAELADLDHIASLGFRGEALASIGAISRAWIRSRQDGVDSGYEVRSEGGAVQDVRPCACPPGSILEIRDLFYNTPARRRFLKTPRAEKAKCQDLLIRLALARLDVDFTFTVDGKEVLRLPAGENLRDRVGRTFGPRLAKSLVEVEHQIDNYRVEGWIADPDASRRDSTQELLYINGRCAKDKSVLFAVRQAYREFLMHGRYPVYFLHLSLPPEDVDVNVHPTKSEVRFVNGRLASGVLNRAVKQALMANDTRESSLSVGEDRPQARSGLPDLPQDLFGRGDVAATPSFQGRAASAGGGEQVVFESADREFSPHAEPETRAADDSVEPAAAPSPFAALQQRRFLQVHNLYLLFEGEDGIVVVDQHALHERVLYERFRARHDDRALAVQRLLVPDVVEVEEADKEWLLSGQEALAAQGFLIEDFGAGAVAIQGIPAVLGRANPKKVVETFLDGVGEAESRPSAREAIVERFHSMACRAAVMSGDRLSEVEIAALLEEAQTLEHPHNCPHGRPTVLTFTGPELEKYFRRRV